LLLFASLLVCLSCVEMDLKFSPETDKSGFF
jgi:hypothetical protein